MAEDDGSGELQLSTTPLRLLNAVDARVSLLQVASHVCLELPHTETVPELSPAADIAELCCSTLQCDAK